MTIALRRMLEPQRRSEIVYDEARCRRIIGVVGLTDEDFAEKGFVRNWTFGVLPRDMDL